MPSLHVSALMSAGFIVNPRGATFLCMDQAQLRWISHCTWNIADNVPRSGFNPGQNRDGFQPFDAEIVNFDNAAEGLRIDIAKGAEA